MWTLDWDRAKDKLLIRCAMLAHLAAEFSGFAFGDVPVAFGSFTIQIIRDDLCRKRHRGRRTCAFRKSSTPGLFSAPLACERTFGATSVVPGQARRLLKSR